MEIEFDPAKDAVNIEKHGLPLPVAARIELETALVIRDVLFEYGEPRLLAFAMLDARLHVMTFTMRGDVVRVINLRKANRRKSFAMASPKKPEHISQQDWDDADIPEVSDEEFARARPFSEVFPNVYEALTRGPGRPPVETPKVHVGFRLAADVVSGIKATGRGYNARVEKVLRDALAEGRL